MIDAKVPNNDYADYVISTVKKTVKQEDALIRQIFYAGLSAATPDPINLGIIAPTSEGKTYPVMETLKMFPKEMVWKIGSMSTKVLVRQKGTLVNENNEPIQAEIDALKKKRAELKKDDPEYKEATEQLRALYEKSRYLIKLQGTILVFLEPPHHELWNLLKPILSHDSYYIEHPFVDRTDRSGFEVKKIVTEGWPACIFCSAKDESNWPVWPEIVSRFLITSPNMNQTKYQESTTLIAQRKGLPSLLQKQLIVSDSQIETAQNCCRYILEEIGARFQGQDMEKPGASVWIPYGEILSEALPTNKGSDVRTAKRIFSFLNIIPLARSHLRMKLYYGLETLTIAALHDLREVLHITHNLNGIPAYKLSFFRDYFYPLYQSRGEAITTRELCEYFKAQTGKALTSNNMKSTYLNELQNAGYIDSKQSDADKREYVFWPIIEISNYNNQDAMDNYLRYARINIPKNCRNIPDDWLISELQTLANYPFDTKVRIYSENGKRLSPNEFADLYEQTDALNGYFTKRQYSRKYKLFGEMKPKVDNPDSEQSKKLSIADGLVQMDDR